MKTSIQVLAVFGAACLVIIAVGIVVFSMNREPKPLPAWSVVCDGKGYFTFTDENGNLWAGGVPFQTRADAQKYLDQIKPVAHGELHACP